MQRAVYIQCINHFGNLGFDYAVTHYVCWRPSEADRVEHYQILTVILHQRVSNNVTKHRTQDNAENKIAIITLRYLRK